MIGFINLFAYPIELGAGRAGEPAAARGDENGVKARERAVSRRRAGKARGV